MTDEVDAISGKTGTRMGMAVSTEPLRRFRRRLLAVAAAAAALWIASLCFGSVLEGSWSVLVDVVGIGLLVTTGACLLARTMVSSYGVDVAHLRPFASGFGYVVRAGAYGVAGAGMGVLLVEAIPRHIDVGSLDSMSAQGIVVIAFGTAGSAVGLLEEWRHQHPEAGPGPAPSAAHVIESQSFEERESMNEDQSLRAIDRWVIGAAVMVAVALTAASVLRPEAIGTYASALGGLGAISVLYFVFGR